MKKIALFTAGLLACSGAAHAQFLPQSGLSPNTVLHAPDTAWDGQKLSAALGALQKDIPGGIAGMDASGNVTATVNTPGVDTSTVALGDLLDTGRTSFRSMIDGQSILRVSAAHRQANPAGEDPWTDPDGVVIGGLATGRGSHVVITAQDEGGMNLGSVLSLWNSNDTYTGNRPGLSPTTGAQIASYNAFDAVVVDNGTKSTTPKIVASSAFTGSDGVRHSVFFDSGSVWISPVLSDADRAKLKQHQTIISNVSTPDYVNRLDSYGAYAVNGFSGMLDNWSFSLPCPSGFAGASVCDQLDVDTWVIPGSGNATTTNPQTYATTASNLDTHYDAGATSPAIYLGARTKQFNHLLTCELGDFDTAPNDAGVDAQHSLMRECENGEYDDELHTAISGKYHFNGLTIGVDSHTKGAEWVDGTVQTDGYNAWPDKTSWGIYLGGQLPNLLELSPFTSDFVKAIAGNTFNVTNPISAGSSPGDTALMSSLFKNAGTSSMTLNQWEQCDAASGAVCPDHNAMSLRIGLRVGGTVGSMTDGAAGANMAFSGDGSLKLCTASGTCATQSSSGDWEFKGALVMNNNWLKMAGQAILMASSSASGAPYILIQTNSKGEVNPSYGGGASGAYVSPGYPYAALPGVASGTTAPTVGAMLYCTDCYSSGNAAKTLSIPVWWNGSAWTDALGQPAQH